MRTPTPKQRTFALHVVEGMSPSDAYRKSYDADGMSPSSVAREAYDLMRNPNITPLLKEGFTRAMQDATWCRALAIEQLEKVNRICLDSIVTSDGQIDRSALTGFLESTDRLNELCFVQVETSDAMNAFKSNPERLKKVNEQSRTVFESELAAITG